MPDLNLLELAGLVRILRKYGYIVLDQEGQVNIEDTLAKMLDTLNAIAAAVSAQPTAVLDAVTALKSEVDALSADGSIEEGKLDALKTATDAIQKTLGPIPA